MEECVGNISIVSHQQKARSLFIQTTDRKESSRIRRHEAHDGTAPAIIAHRGHNAAGLIHDPIGGPLISDPLAVKANIIHGRIGLFA